MTVAGQSFTLTQLSCTYAISPTAETFGNAGGTGSVNVTTQNGCSWNVANIPAWASTLSGGSGTGSGTWNYSVTANPGGGIQTITVAGQSFALTELAFAVKTMRSRFAR